ncbi:oxidoreductase (homolog to zinc-containing alcohol dehydrogenase) (plasmid) [Haloferax gibbonsii]|uniref:Oxidoreductase (Homolog to zinc-containing alcohol dehydrogenase) n=2 Tax=Haloferax gibbonsii TaxID=35746 RepID=A0A871BKK8_HALGI|nr:oxidoreductase (homolog to zinc-containing alcohol dehydrogenase) [Haloferax gibbonsii]
MRAVVAKTYGSADVLRVEEVATPIPDDDEVLVRIHATVVGPPDSATREGRPFLIRFFSGLRRPTAVPGDVFAGEVVAVGRSVVQFAPGDDVFGTAAPGSGAHAEYLCLPADGAIAVMPSELTYREAAAVCDGGLTAMAFLEDHAHLQADESILVNGASGSVGTAAVQIASALGATVTGVCSTANVDLVRSLGAETVIDYTTTDFAATGTTYDVIFDAVGKRPYSTCKDSLAPGGRYLTTVLSVQILLQMLSTRLVGDRRASFAATGLGSAETKREHLHTLRDLVESGVFRPVIDRVYALDDIADAHRYVDTGHKVGSVLVTVE